MEMVVDYVYKSNDVKELIFLNNRFERNFVFVARLLSVDLGGREKGTTPCAVARNSSGSLNGDDDDDVRYYFGTK